MTGVSSVPIGRPGIEIQAAAAPGYHLSSSAREDPRGEAMPQASALFEPDELIGVPGLFAGGRYAGEATAGAALEPLLGYRFFLDRERRFALGTVGSLVYQSESADDADFSALRGGIELSIDARLTAPSQYAELHTNLGASFTVLDAEGRYCVDPATGFGVDCASQAEARSPADASLGGVFPSAHAGLSLELARHLKVPFHGVRVGVDLAGGTLPTLLAGEQRSAKPYGAAGVSLTLGLGADERREHGR
jgi:hypothetical protein